MAKVLITGGAGFIGSNLAHALVKGNDITIVDDLSMGKKEKLFTTSTPHVFNFLDYFVTS